MRDWRLESITRDKGDARLQRNIARFQTTLGIAVSTTAIAYAVREIVCGAERLHMRT